MSFDDNKEAFLIMYYDKNARELRRHNENTKREKMKFSIQIFSYINIKKGNFNQSMP